MNPKARHRTTAEAACRLLADSYGLYLKTHNFHWNVTGPMFTPLHALFESQYTELAAAVDGIAERIRALGEIAPGTYAELSRLARVKDASGVPRAEGMVRELAADHALVADAARELLATAEAENDPASADLAVRRIDASEKAAWMLRSHLE